MSATPTHITLAQQKALVEGLGLTWGGDVVEIRITVTEVEITSHATIDGTNRIDDKGRVCLVVDRIPVLMRCTADCSEAHTYDDGCMLADPHGARPGPTQS